MIKNITFGSDAEVFLKDSTGRFFPVCGIVGGTKDHPKDLGDGYAVQEDNVLLEFNIPPAKDEMTFISNMDTGYKKATKGLPPSLFAVIEASANFDPNFLTSPQASRFGCDPDMNVWKRSINPSPGARDRTLRTAAAHVHIGWDKPTEEDCENLIKAADLFVSIPSLYEDKDTKRRELYGKAGAFRFKPYGVEHRVLSNYWIANEKFISAVYRRYLNAIKFVNSNQVISQEDGEMIQNAINNNDKTLGDKLYRKFNLH